MKILAFVSTVLITFISVFISCRSKSVEFEQYYNQGEILYSKYCSNCHQTNGKGLGLLYPPLDKSDFVDENFEQVLCIMKNGKSTPTVVNGKTFVQPMKGVAALTDLEIAEIATYIYNTWDRQGGIVSVNEVISVTQTCDSKAVY